MSWSINYKGTPESVAGELEAHSEKLEGASKVEYDAALPHLVGLVKQNVGGKTVSISANGHGWVENGVIKDNQCQVNISVAH